MAVEAAPTWKGIVQAADERNASLIVLGPHRRSGLLGHLQGSVAAAVISHTTTPVLLVPVRCNGREAHVETQTAAGVSNNVASSLARIASSDCQELVTMQRPDVRSTSRDKPTHPSMSSSAGITLSRVCAIPASM
jgi:hypothetical protein